MKKGSLYAVFYAAVLGVVCALALTAVDGWTADRKDANARAEEVRNILSVLGVPFDAGASADELVAVYDASVRQETRGALEVHSYRHPESGTLSAVRFEGPGLWGPVEGFLCLREDMTTIQAVTFYKHEETPGLGGEISSDAFQDQFRGKSLLGDDGLRGIRIVGDGADGPNEVDAISGATMTSDKVEEMLNALIERMGAGSATGPRGAGDHDAPLARGVRAGGGEDG
ncbi:MAG: FMN-binding protein [Candidatus Eisenbacteria bacterium]